jgi:hypothetical protein
MGRKPGDGFFMADFTLLEVAEMRLKPDMPHSRQSMSRIKGVAPRVSKAKADYAFEGDAILQENIFNIELRCVLLLMNSSTAARTQK